LAQSSACQEVYIYICICIYMVMYLLLFIYVISACAYLYVHLSTRLALCVFVHVQSHLPPATCLIQVTISHVACSPAAKSNFLGFVLVDRSCTSPDLRQGTSSAK
jgi:hypothetical protein